MAAQPQEDRHPPAADDRVAGTPVTKVVKADVVDAGVSPDPVPELEFPAARARRVARRGNPNWLPPRGRCSRMRRARELRGDALRPGLGIGEDHHVIVDLEPPQLQDLAPAAPGQQQQPEDVGLLPAAFLGVIVQNPLQAADLLARQESASNMSGNCAAARRASTSSTRSGRGSGSNSTTVPVTGWSIHPECGTARQGRGFRFVAFMVRRNSIWTP